MRVSLSTCLSIGIALLDTTRAFTDLIDHYAAVSAFLTFDSGVKHICSMTKGINSRYSISFVHNLQ